MASIVADISYDPDQGVWVDSEREYDVYEVMAIEVGDRWDPNRGVTLRLYVDELTGVVVKDIAAYEGSMK